MYPPTEGSGADVRPRGSQGRDDPVDEDLLPVLDHEQSALRHPEDEHAALLPAPGREAAGDSPGGQRRGLRGVGAADPAVVELAAGRPAVVEPEPAWSEGRGHGR